MLIKITENRGSVKDGEYFNPDTISRIETGEYLVSPTTFLHKGVKLPAIYLHFTDGKTSMYTFETAEQRDAKLEKLLEAAGGLATI
jgi:hypothetical protein